jgi:hypothetical protein
MASIKWLKTEEVPEHIREMLADFEEAFSISNTGYKVSHLRDDAIFVCVPGWCNPYSVAQFVRNNPGIYCEITAKARNYYEFRMFCSEWLQQRELPRMRAIANTPKRGNAAPLSVRVQTPAWKDWKGEVDRVHSE